METATIDTWTMILQLLGGLAIFLFGLDQLTDMLKASTGTRMRDLLATVTTNRFKGVLAGGFTTAVIQSSSVTTVLVVGFVSAGLMSLQQSIGVIMGAGIGTTVTAQIIAFKVTQYALVPVIIGFVMQFFSDHVRVKRYGTMLLGLGLVFYGMNLMGDATLPLRSYPPFVDLLARMDNPYVAVLISAGFTAVIQSSSATTAVIIVLASQGLISLEQGIPLVFGANIGTCVTAMLATIRKQRPALRAALVHVLFNVFGVLIWFGFIDELAALARWISPAGGGELESAARQIANAHTLFNVGNTMIFIWFTGAFAWLVTKLVPEKRLAGPEVIEPRFLDRGLIGTPALALDAARMEIIRMAGHVVPMVKQVAPAVLSGSAADLDHIQDLDKEVDILHRAIVHYLGKVSQETLTAAETESLHDYLAAATLYENIGDTVKTDLVHTGRERLLHNVHVSPGTEDMLASLVEKVVWAMETTTDAIDRGDPSLARRVIDAKGEVNLIADRISERLVQRLIAEDPHRTSTFHIESQLIEHFKRVYYSAKRVAKLVAEPEVIDGQIPPVAASHS